VVRVVLAAGLLTLFLLAADAAFGQAPPGPPSPAYYVTRRIISYPVLLPNPSMTPGAVSTSDTAIVCHRHTATVRPTTDATKAKVYAAYGVVRHREGDFEVDHLVPLELGGADTITNLWPQPASPKPGFHEKDYLETRMHVLACAGRIPLDSAQRWIARNWADAFGALVGAWPR